MIIVDANIILRYLLNDTETLSDFVDTLLYAYYKVRNHEVYTFDKKLNKLLG